MASQIPGGERSDSPTTLDLPVRSTDNAQCGPQRPHSVLLRLGLLLLICHFESAKTVKQSLLEEYDKTILKKTLTDTVRDPEVRQEIGSDRKFWNDLSEVLTKAIPSVTSNCFFPGPVNSSMLIAASSKRIVQNYGALTKDLVRLQDLMSIARNVMVIGNVAQDLAAECSVHPHVLDLITLCIKVTHTRGFSAEGSQQDEEKWQFVVDEFKKLMIRCLQVLNNLMTNNENRSIMLWMELFDEPDKSGPAQSRLHQTLANNNGSFFRLSQELMSSYSQPLPPKEYTAFSEAAAEAARGITELLTNPFLLYFGSVGIKVRKELEANDKPSNAIDIAAECKTRWENESQEARQEWVELYNQLNVRSANNEPQISGSPTKDSEFITPSRFNLLAAQESLRHIADQLMQFQEQAGFQSKTSPTEKTKERSQLHDIDQQPMRNQYQQWDTPDPYAHGNEIADEDDFRVTCVEAQGSDILEQGKQDLLRRLEPEPEKSNSQVSTEQSTPTQPIEVQDPATMQMSSPTSATQAVNSEDDESEEEEPEAIPGDKSRGLLTDVPVVLGPGEVEVLPMIIQTAILPDQEALNVDRSGPSIQNMHVTRCRMLLAHDYGKNLLKELLIFIAAWDLREDELYFKLMSNIMQAILLNGLMPLLYRGLTEARDIVSPAQAVIMKLLTGIFRKRQQDAYALERQTAESNTEVYPQRCEAKLITFLFTEFRKVIIPQTCALIFLQGKIKSGIAGPDDFPLNLWDMERMYEGIYQYLEFFAILTEHRVWKVMMSEWNIVNELITLIEELDAAIPRQTLKSQEALQVYQSGRRIIEAPYGNVPHEPNLTPQDKDPPEHVADNYPLGPSEEEPSNFEWRNLKKLAVLVISSLVFRNPRIQQQLGAPDSQGRPGRGIRAMLNACKIDDFNPYIKEHSVMALKFALEESEENQRIVHQLKTSTQLSTGQTVQYSNEADTSYEQSRYSANDRRPATSPN